MYPLLCPGGYGIPMKRGKFDIVKITAAYSAGGSEAQLQLCDSERIAPSSKTKDEKILVDLKSVATYDSNIVFDCPEPIKVRNALSPLILTNLVPGSVIVYIK